MSNVKLIFLSSDKSNLETELECFFNSKNEIFISICSQNDAMDQQCICFDKETAVKFVKHLKREISFIESEVKNG